MAFHFPLMPRIFMAVALEDRYPIAEILRQTPDIPDNCQWAIFLRNHDELTLEMVTDRERDYMYRMYAQEPRMRVNVGIRRRLAPLLGNDIDRIKLMNSLLLSMPGSPIIYYGDEIGMGDNIYIGDRNGVRTPMQWSIDRNAGFSRADPQRLYLPVIMDPIYGYQAVNVEAQSRDPYSLLNWTRRILTVRRQQGCFGRGALEFVRPQNRKIIAYVRCLEQQIVLCVANLSQTAQAVELDLAKYKGRVPVELMGRNSFPPIGELPYFLTLPAHGFYWLLLSDSAAPPAWHVERLPATELPVLVLSQELATFLPNGAAAPGAGGLARRTLQQLEQEVLPEYLRARGWIAAHIGRITGARLGQRTLWRSSNRTFLLAFVEVESDTAAPQRYFLPLALSWEGAQEEGSLLSAEWTLAKVREHARAGMLIDAFAEPSFCLGLLRCVAANAAVPFAGGELRFECHGAAPELGSLEGRSVQHVGADGTTTDIMFEEKLFLKAYRRAEPGPSPDVEMTRFLTDAGCRSVAPLAGSITHMAEQQTVIAAVFAWVRNQGDAWTYTLNHLERFASGMFSQDALVAEQPHALFLAQMQTLGRRIGELHALLCAAKADEAFAPEQVGPADLTRWNDVIQLDVAAILPSLQRRLPALSGAAAQAAQQLLARTDGLSARVRELSGEPIEALKMRVHGNLHLGKVLLIADDFLVTGFEGDVSLPIAARRSKDSPLRDVATLLRSFDRARAIALERAVAGRPDVSERLEPALGDWLRKTIAAFLRGYRRTISDSACLPPSEAVLARLLTLFQLAGALRELRRELERRPARIGVPIQAILALLEVESPMLSEV
jgi:maltose alpha-D-glucosyltransferase / alpha-amylase